MKTIRQVREERGWTQLHLAIQLGVTPVTIYNWERGNSEPRVSQFRQLARLLGVSMDELALTSEEGRETDEATGQQREDPGAPERLN